MSNFQLETKRKTHIDYLELQKTILNFVDHGFSEGSMEAARIRLVSELSDLTIDGIPWPLKKLNELAERFDISPASKLLATGTGNKYGRFLDAELDQEIEPGREREFIRKKIMEAGWKGPVKTLADLIELAHSIGEGGNVDFVFALLNGENFEDLQRLAFQVL